MVRAAKRLIVGVSIFFVVQIRTRSRKISFLAM